MVRKRILLAQNFFKDRKLVASIVTASSVCDTDTVYEVGPGEGIITEELAKRAGRVIAIEKDVVLIEQLRRKFRDARNVQIQGGDFLEFAIKDRDYKIFSNIPFNLTAQIVKRILFEENPAKETYLVVQREAAEKFTGFPSETEISVLAKPWFVLRVLREFRKTDFEPIPSVNVVLLHIEKREQPLVSLENAWRYKKFVKFGFESWKKDLKTAYKKVFTHEQWKRLSKNLDFTIGVTPGELKFKQWLGLFEYFLAGVTDAKKSLVFSQSSRSQQ